LNGNSPKGTVPGGLNFRVQFANLGIKNESESSVRPRRAKLTHLVAIQEIAEEILTIGLSKSTVKKLGIVHITTALT
jgi:hypothetical protein